MKRISLEYKIHDCLYNHNKVFLATTEDVGISKSVASQLEEKLHGQVDNPLHDQIKIIHEMNIPPPNYIYTIFKYWKDGSHGWIKGADVNKNTEIIPNGSIDKSNIFVIGDAFSKYQGWIIGALNSVDIALNSFPNYN